MKPAKIAVICIAAVAAIGLALVVRAMGSSGKPTAVAVAVEAPPMAKVLVAARDLEPGKRLTDGDLSWKDWPVAEVNPVFIGRAFMKSNSLIAHSGALTAERSMNGGVPL